MASEKDVTFFGWKKILMDFCDGPHITQEADTYVELNCKKIVVKRILGFSPSHDWGRTSLKIIFGENLNILKKWDF